MTETLSVAAYRALFDLPEQRAPVRSDRSRAGITIDDIFVPVFFANLNLQPEQSLSCRLYQALVAEHRAGRLRAVCTCIPNELPRPSRGGKSIQGFAIAVQNKRRAMGRIPGASDWVFTWAAGNLWAELKDPGGQVVMRKVKRAAGDVLRPVKTSAGSLSAEQIAFQGWCDRLNVPKATWYDVPTAIEELRRRGALGT